MSTGSVWTEQDRGLPERLAQCLQFLGIWRPLNAEKKQIMYTEALLCLHNLISTTPTLTLVS